MADGSGRNRLVRWLSPQHGSHISAAPDCCDVLILNSSAGFPGTISRALQRHGFAVVEADSPEQALRGCVDLCPDIALLNLQLPDAAGLELIQQLRAVRTGARPVILVFTGSQDGDDVLDALDAGADAVTMPPFSLDELVRVVRNLRLPT